MRELCRLKEELSSRGVRFLAAGVKGEIAGWCEMRCDDSGGQVEDVVVLEPFRGRGLARALVCGAIERLRSDGWDPILVVANDNETVNISTGAWLRRRPPQVELLVAGPW